MPCFRITVLQVATIMINLSPDQRRALKARAHHLEPTAMIGDAGLTEAVLKEIGKTLTAHELIKIKVHQGERELRDALLTDICEKLDAAPVQHIGKILVVYKPSPETKLSASVKPVSKPKAAKPDVARRPATPGSRPGTPRARSASGTARSKPRATSQTGRGKRSP